MLKSKEVIVITILLSIVMVLTSCGTDEEEAMKPQEEPQTKIKKINYQTKVEEIDEAVQETLKNIRLKRQKLATDKSVTKIKKTEEYQFDWSYNIYQLQVPLFGAGGRLLSDYRTEVIEKFKEQFEVVDLEWNNTQQQRLVLNIGFKAQDEFKLITHQLVFTQPLPKAKMAIIIDDFGFNRQGTKGMLSINRPMTAAVLPFRPYSKKDAKLAKEAGLEVILHQPLEPISPQANPGQGAIYTDMEEEEIKQTFLKNLNSLPKVSGINHHMGSKASADLRVMKQLLSVVKDKDLFYVDSSTSQHTVGAKIARQKNIPTKENHLFIDNVDKQREIEKMISRLSEVALAKKELIIVGHVKKNTAQAIKKMIPELEQKGIKLVYASQIVN